MKLFDKILIGAAGLSVYGMAMIVFSGELNSDTYHEEYQPRKIARQVSDVSLPSAVKKGQGGGVVIYDREVDEIIQAYFKNIKENPNKLEEENRLINDTSFNDSDSEKKPDKKTAVKPEKKDDTIHYVSHTVKEGESLWRIANKYKVPVYTIISANPNKDKEMIHPGETLEIPSMSGVVYHVKKGDTISEIAKKYKLSSHSIMESNAMYKPSIFAGETIFLPNAHPVDLMRIVFKHRFIWPVVGRITSGYGMRKHPLNNSMQFHTGIDIGANIGDKIHAAANGVVVYSGDGGTYGNMVILRHKDGYLSIYAHASKLLVKKGQYVKQGQEIARVGVTGLTTGPHLHFEVKKYQNRINPLQALHEKIKLKVPVKS